MTPELYKRAATTALTQIEAAMSGATFLLPRDVRVKYEIAKNHAVEPWDDVKQGYYGREDCDPAVGLLLTNLVLLAQARAQLRAVLMVVPTQPPSLGLARTRRTP